MAISKTLERKLSIKEYDSHFYSIDEFNNSIDRVLSHYFGQIMDNAQRLFSKDELSHFNITFEEALTQYNCHKRIECLSSMVDLIAIKSDEICDLMNIASNAYGINVFSALFLKWKGDNVSARIFFSLAAQPQLNVSIDEVNSFLNGQSGGRPTHERRDEAMELAAKAWRETPVKTLDQMVKDIHTELEKGGRYAPSISVLRKWFREADFRPGGIKKKSKNECS